jgi:hypothetical protein
MFVTRTIRLLNSMPATTKGVTPAAETSPLLVSYTESGAHIRMWLKGETNEC